MKIRKFRAYHDEWGWALPADISVYGDGTIYVDYRGENGNIVETYTEKTKELHVMDYTGLEDKNGKEIYESDIVDNGMKFTNSIRMVLITPSGAQTKIINEEGSGLFAMVLTAQMRNKKVKIIGNKYDNPELLKNENIKKSKILHGRTSIMRRMFSTGTRTASPY